MYTLCCLENWKNKFLGISFLLKQTLLAWVGTLGFCSFSETMAGLGSFYTPHRSYDSEASVTNRLQSAKILVTNADDSRKCPVSSVKRNTLTNADRKTRNSSPAVLDEADLEMEAISENENPMDSVDGLKRRTLNSSSEPPLSKPIREYMDESLPDLLRSGSPLRRRVSSPVSDTLKQMRREVELSRRRSLKIKAQVDKLQERSQDGLAWSQTREQVTEEIQSIVKLLQPLTDPDPATDHLSQSNSLDEALLQLKNVSRTLALNHASQGKAKDGRSDEEMAVLQQALRDRDDALVKKQAMESELLKCKTEMMFLNNQLLEAVQRRLEMAIELEAWKDDVQTILHHQLLSQQQAEQQSQKKSRGFLRLSKHSSPAPSPSVSRASSPGAQSPNTPVAQRWKDRLRRGRGTLAGFDTPDQPASPVEPPCNIEDSFQSVSLD